MGNAAIAGTSSPSNGQQGSQYDFTKLGQGVGEQGDALALYNAADFASVASADDYSTYTGSRGLVDTSDQPGAVATLGANGVYNIPIGGAAPPPTTYNLLPGETLGASQYQVLGQVFGGSLNQGNWNIWVDGGGDVWSEGREDNGVADQTGWTVHPSAEDMAAASDEPSVLPPFANFSSAQMQGVMALANGTSANNLSARMAADSAERQQEIAAYGHPLPQMVDHTAFNNEQALLRAQVEMSATSPIGAVGSGIAYVASGGDIRTAYNVGTAMEVASGPALAVGMVASTASMRATNEAVPNTLTRSDLGELLGRGGNKDVFAYGDSQAVGVLRTGKNPAILSEELSLLGRLDELGLPTVNARGPIAVDDQPALLFDRYAQGSKDVVRLQDGRVRVVGESPLLNQQSVNDLQGIRQTMENNNIRINDLQFLIGNDGRIVVADPLGVQVGVPPSKNNLRMIDLLIQQAQRGE